MAHDDIPNPVLGLPMVLQNGVFLAICDDSVGSPSPLETWQTNTNLGLTVVEKIFHPLEERGTPVAAEEQPKLPDFVMQSEEAEHHSIETEEENADRKALERSLWTAEKHRLSTNKGGPTILSVGSLRQGLQVPGSTAAHSEKYTSLQLFPELPVPTMLKYNLPDLNKLPDLVVWKEEECADQKRLKTHDGRLQTAEKHTLTANLHDKHGEHQGQRVQRILEFKAEFWSEANQQEIDFWQCPHGQSARGPSLDLVLSSLPLDILDLLLSSLPLELSEKIMSLVPMEKLIEWCSVSKDWKALILSSRLGIFGHNIKPSTKNGPIALISRYQGELPRDRMATYNRTLNIWQDQDTRHLIWPPFGALSTFSTCVGLLCRPLSNERTLHNYRGVLHPMTIDICNPITKEHRQLRVPLAHEVHAGKRGNSKMTSFWGVIVASELDSYKVIVQNVTSLPNEGGPESVTNRILMYNSVSRLWEIGGTLSPEIISRVGRRICCSTSSKGNLYFLTTSRDPRAFERSRPRLIKYDPQRRRCTEINTPLLRYSGRGEPIIVEHRGHIIFVTRHMRQRHRRRRNLWVFLKLEEENLNWVKINEVPEDEFDMLCQRITNVKCHGNGDLIYFYGAAQGRSEGTVSVLAHDLVKNSWVWLADFQAEKAFVGLLSIQPSFIKV